MCRVGAIDYLCCGKRAGSQNLYNSVNNCYHSLSIMGNPTGLFDTVNTRSEEIAVQVGTTPAAWNAGVFSLIRQLSETVILPIAGLILTFVATYELI